MAIARCAAYTNAGKRCSKKPAEGCMFCTMHANKNNETEPEAEHLLRTSVPHADAESDTEPTLPIPEPEHLDDAPMPDIVAPAPPISLETAESNPSPIPLPPAPPQPDVTALVNELRMMKLELQNEKKRYEVEITNLKKQLSSVEQSIMTSTILSDNTTIDTLTSKKSRKKKPPTPEDIAMRLFYHDNKKNIDIINKIGDNLKTVNMYISDKHIPWQLVRGTTDFIFTNLTPDQKQVYINRAMKST